MSEETHGANRYPILGGLYWAIFNSNEGDRLKGYAAVLKRHGAVAKRKIIAHIRKRKGVMAIFELEGKDAAMTFAETVGDSAEARRAKRDLKARMNADHSKMTTTQRLNATGVATETNPEGVA